MATLGEWEQDLCEKIAFVELLGELNLTEEHVQIIGSLIAELVQHLGHAQAFQVLERKFPTCLAVYLVAKGVYGYDSGTYWASIGEETGLSGPNAHQRLGQFFEQFLQMNQLPTFRGVGGHRYV